MKKSFYFSITIVIISTIVFGILNTIQATTIASLTREYTSELLITLIIAAAAKTAMSAIKLISAKFTRLSLMDKLYMDLLKKVLNSKMSDISKVSTGKIYDAVKDIASLKSSIIVASIMICMTIMPFSKLIFEEWQYNHLMPIIEISCMTVGITMSLLTNRLFKTNAIAKEKKAILQGITVDNFLNVRTLKYMRQRQFAIDRLAKAQDDARVLMVNPKQIIWYRFVEIIGWTPFILNIYLARRDISFVAFLICMSNITDQMWCELSNIIETFIEMKAQETVIKDLKGDDLDNYDALENELVLRNIEFGYKDSDVKFRIDDIRIKKNHRYLITGESGQGKSTLANLLAGVITPIKGEIKNLSVFYVWQETEMFDATLWQNIVFGNSDNISESEILDLFKDLGMIDWFENLPSGFSTQIGEKGCKLSSGQKQRLNIIRTIIHMRRYKDDLFILDEITSNLDEYTKALAIKLIDRECKSTLVCISHNDGFDTICNKHIEVIDHKFIMV